jgi:prophage regulatory protein
MAEKFLSLREVLGLTSLSKTHTYRLINAGNFPRPVPLGPHRVAFLESEVEAWMAARLQARDQDEGVQARRERARKSVTRADHVIAVGDRKDGVRNDG